MKYVFWRTGFDSTPGKLFQVTQCSRILLEKLIVTQLVKKFSAFYVT